MNFKLQTPVYVLQLRKGIYMELHVVDRCTANCLKAGCE